MPSLTFPDFIVFHAWTLRVRVHGRPWQEYIDVDSFAGLAVLLKRFEGEVISVKLLCGIDKWGPIEEGRAGYAVHNGQLRQAPELKYEIRSCVGLAQCFNEWAKGEKEG